MKQIEQNPQSSRPFQYRLRTLLLVMLLVALYLGTWIGGTESHRRELQARAEREWNRRNVRDGERAEETDAIGRNGASAGLPEGAYVKVDWSFPLLPGVLIVESSYHLAPRWSTGGQKLVLYYGVGSVEFLTLSLCVS